jgi:hypothetical protein
MAVTKSQVLKAGKTPAFPIGEGDITFHYTRPTPAYYDSMQGALASVDQDALTVSRTIAAQLMPLITDWDYLGDDEKPLKITEENLLSLPLGILKECYQYIIDVETGNSKNAPPPSAPTS